MFVVSQILALFTAWSIDKEKNVTKAPFIFELILVLKKNIYIFDLEYLWENPGNASC